MLAATVLLSVVLNGSLDRVLPEEGEAPPIESLTLNGLEARRARLLEERPTFTGAKVRLAVGGALTTVGGVGTALLVAFMVASPGSVATLFLGVLITGALFITGLVVSIIGVIVLFRTIRDREAVDEAIQEVERRQVVSSLVERKLMTLATF